MAQHCLLWQRNSISHIQSWFVHAFYAWFAHFQSQIQIYGWEQYTFFITTRRWWIGGGGEDSKTKASPTQGASPALSLTAESKTQTKTFTKLKSSTNSKSRLNSKQVKHNVNQQGSEVCFKGKKYSVLNLRFSGGGRWWWWWSACSQMPVCWKCEQQECWSDPRVKLERGKC